MMECIIKNLSTCSNIMAPHFGLQDPFQLFNVSKVMGTRDCTWRNVWKAHLPVEIAIWGGKKNVFRHLEIRNGLDNSKKVMCEFFFDKSILPTDVHIFKSTW